MTTIESINLDDGQLIAGRYKIIRRIGFGAMGQVYEVEDKLSDEAEKLRRSLDQPQCNAQTTKQAIEYVEPTMLDRLTMESRQLILRLAEIENLKIELQNDPSLESKIKKFRNSIY